MQRNIMSESVFIRGFVLNKVSLLESYMDFFLSTHFSKDKILAQELLSLVFATRRVAFDSKREIIYLIADKHYKGVLENYRSFNKDMQSIATQRNIFAHWHLYYTDDAEVEFAENGSVSFTRHANSTEIERYSVERLDVFYELISTYSKLMETLRQNIPLP